MSDILKTWCFSGSASWKIDAGSDKVVEQPHGTFNGENASAIYFTIESDSNDKLDFVMGHAFNTTTQKSTNICWDYSYTTISSSGNLEVHHRKNCGAITIPTLKNTFRTNIPMFRLGDDEAINNYLQNGDDSGRVNPPMYPTKWDLYIDGSKNPLYKLTWDCADVPKSDYSKVKILYCASFDNKFLML